MHQGSIQRMGLTPQPLDSAQCNREAWPNDTVLREGALAHDVARTGPGVPHRYRAAMRHMRIAITVRDCELVALVQLWLWKVD